MLSDKGKQTIVCYTNTYNTLMVSHFGDTNTYHPVIESDESGKDLESMTKELSNKLKGIARGSCDQNVKKLVKDHMRPAVVKFPEGLI